MQMNSRGIPGSGGDKKSLKVENGTATGNLVGQLSWKKEVYKEEQLETRCEKWVTLF